MQVYLNSNTLRTLYFSLMIHSSTKEILYGPQPIQLTLIALESSKKKLLELLPSPNTRPAQTLRLNAFDF